MAAGDAWPGTIAQPPSPAAARATCRSMNASHGAIEVARTNV
jgi:hypothetical protein